MPDQMIQAKVVDYAFDSKNAVQYCPKWEVEFNVTKGRVHIPAVGMSADFDHQLFWLKTLGGRWVFDFDRANSSNTAMKLFFCRECGQPFSRFTEIGTHTNQYHNKNEAIIKQAQQDAEDEAEIKAVSEQYAIDAAKEAERKSLAARLADARAKAAASSVAAQE